VSSTLRGSLSEVDEIKDSDRELKNSATIASLVKNNAMFDTLEAALEAADLEKTLQGPGPFTVFAPTDKAFAKLGHSTIQGLLKDKAKLSDILLYHVVPGKVLRKDVKNEVIKAANGDNLRTGVTKKRSRVVINDDARVTKANVQAKNGVIHFIDEVLLPPENLLDTIKGEKNLSTLAAAIKAAGLESTLSDVKSDLTIFAPTDKAFEALGEGAVSELIKTPEKLKSILLYHAVPGSVLKGALKGDGSVKTVQGSNFHFDEKGSKLFINDSEVIEANILASNGVVHVIDEVLEIP